MLVSNVREEDEDDLLAAVRLLRRNHIVLIASIREGVLDEVTHSSVSGFQSALDYAGTIDYLQQRRNLFARLGSEGVIVADCLPNELPVALVNNYLALKRAGKF